MTVANVYVYSVGIPYLRLRVRPNTQDVDEIVHVFLVFGRIVFRLLMSAPKNKQCNGRKANTAQRRLHH